MAGLLFTHIKEYRLASNLTIYELVNRANVKWHTVKKLESLMGFDPEISSIYRISRVLGLSIEDLMSSEKIPQGESKTHMVRVRIIFPTLHQHKTRLKMSVREMSKKCGIAASTLSGLLFMGNSDTRLSTVYRISKGLGVPIKEIISEYKPFCPVTDEGGVRRIRYS